MNIVTIDPSLTCTGMTVNGKPFVFASDHIVLTKKQKYTKWFELSSEHCEIITIDTSYGKERSYAKLEINKLNTYTKIVNQIKETVDKHSNRRHNTVCLIEGYSYSSASGPLIDLVTFGTLLRSSFQGSKNGLAVIAPTSLKVQAAKLTYPEIKQGKKLTYRNHEGVAGGSFKKLEMLKVLLENDKIDTDWIRFLREYQEELVSSKNIPKPIEDINDAIIMYHIVQQVIESERKFEKVIDCLRSF